jgi:hypothetical protein
MQLDELKPGLALVGLESDRICTVLAINVIASNAVQVFYRPPDGPPKERLLVNHSGFPAPHMHSQVVIANTNHPEAILSAK